MRQQLRRLLKKIPFIRPARRTVEKIRRRAFNRYLGPSRLRRRLAAATRKQIVIGSSGFHDPDWIPTDIEFLNLLKPADWDRFFEPHSVDAMLAEHVWEHLTPEDALAAAKTCFTYLRPGGYLRVAVPDGLHPDPTYQGWVKVGGASPNQKTNAHKVLYTYKTLTALFQSSGFRVILYEYFDETGTFQSHAWDQKLGTIRRSRRLDKRNQDGTLTFTSIILDAVKE